MDFPNVLGGYFKKHRNKDVKMLPLQDFLILWISSSVNILRTWNHESIFFLFYFCYSFLLANL